MSTMRDAGNGAAAIQMEPGVGSVHKVGITEFDGEPARVFNMSGYAAPKLERVRIGFIGLGNRGPKAVRRMSIIEGVDIKGLCDLRPQKAAASKKMLEKTAHLPDVYTGQEDEWKRMCDNRDID